MISILVLSSDGYSDCWEPFFNLLHKNFSECENHEIILSTNSVEYVHPTLDIRTITHKNNTPWSKRFKDSVISAKNDIILVLVEDDFLRSRMDSKLMNEFISLMKSNDEIDHLRLLSTFDRTKMKSSKYENIEEIEGRTKLRLTYLPALWKKKVLLKYLVDYESPFMSEKIGDFKSRIHKDGFYAVSRDFVDKNGQFYNGMASGVLFRGKWAEWTIPFFKENNINIDFKKRGFATEEFRKTTRSKSRMDLLKSPFLTLRSFLSLAKLYIKINVIKNFN